MGVSASLLGRVGVDLMYFWETKNKIEGETAVKVENIVRTKFKVEIFFCEFNGLLEYQNLPK